MQAIGIIELAQLGRPARERTISEDSDCQQDGRNTYDLTTGFVILSEVCIEIERVGGGSVANSRKLRGESAENPKPRLCGKLNPIRQDAIRGLALARSRGSI